MFDAARITILRRKVWETDRADVNGIQWCFEEDSDRVQGQSEAHGSWVPYSRRLSIMIESHHLVYLSKRGKPQFVVTIESDRKHFHQHTGLQYEIDLVQDTQKNVMTGYVRRLFRRDLANELRARAAATRLQRWFRASESNRCKPEVLTEDQEIETDKVYIMYHGTPSLENAALIEQQGLRASQSGLLGAGVYVSRDVRKAQQYSGSGVVFEVLVRTGRVCHIQDHLVAVHGVQGTVVEVPAKDLVPDKWHDAGYDTAWVPADCPESFFRGGA